MPAPDSGQDPQPGIPAPRRPTETASAGQRRTRPPSTGKSKTDLAIEAAIEGLIAKAPPLSEETRARLAELLSATGLRSASR